MTDWNNEEERVQQIEDWYELSREEDADWLERARESFRFFWGDTWSPAEIQILAERNAPALSINKTQPRVNMLSAMARLNRHEATVKAETDAQDVPTARILTHLMRHIHQKNDQDFVEAWQFLDSLICGRGYFAGDVSYEKNFFGDVTTRYIQPFAIKFDPTAIRPDLLDADYIMEEQWFTAKALEEAYNLKSGGRKKKLGQILNHSAKGEDYTDNDFVTAEARRRMGQFKVKECWHRHYETGFFLVDGKTGKMYKLKDKEEGIQVQEGQEGFFVVEVTRPEVKITATSMGVELFNGDSPFKSPIIPIFTQMCYHAGRRQDGIVEAMKDPQLETNKRRSQMLHLLNQHANMVWIVDQGAIIKGIPWLKEHAGDPGLVIEKRAGTKVDRQISGDFPIGLIHLEQLANKDFFDVSGFSPETMPTSSLGAAGSGRAIALRQQQGMNILSLPMDNQRLTRRMYGRWLLNVIQQYYQTERVIRIEGEEGVDQFIRINGKTSGGLINDVSIGDFDVIVSQEPVSQGNRQAMLNTLVELASQGVPIPPDLILEFTDIPRKDEAIKRVRDAAGQAQQAGAQGSQGGQ